MTTNNLIKCKKRCIVIFFFLNYNCKMDIKATLLLISLIVLFGYFAEWIFEKYSIPDTLSLLLIGFLIGPSVLNLLSIQSLSKIAPLFTTFTLLFLMFDGGLDIDLKSFADGLGSGLIIGLWNFFLSSILITGIMYYIDRDLISALLLGFTLGGITSAYVIPILKQLDVNKKVFTVMTIESSVTDVLSIVFAITIMQIKIAHQFKAGMIFSNIASLFAIAGFTGIIFGILWFYIEGTIVKEDENYIMMIAYVVLVYIITEYLGGNGAISSLFLGLVLANSRTIKSFGRLIKRKRDKDKKQKPIVSKREKLFYKEISFFLKTFFFVYIGLLLNLKNTEAIVIGLTISISLMLIRPISSLFTKKFEYLDRKLINSLFARGIAPAVIILIAKENGAIKDQLSIDVVYFVITASIILSSFKVFLYKLKRKEKQTV